MELFDQLKETKKLANLDLLILHLITTAEYSFNCPKMGAIKLKNVYLKIQQYLAGQ